MKQDKKKMLFIYNPKAGKGKIKVYLSDIIDLFTKNDYIVTVHATQNSYDAVQAVRDREPGYDLVVCSGGDGTLDEVVTGMVQGGEQLPIGYIPAGSTNDFAKSLNIPSDMLAAAKLITEGNVFQCDVGRFDEDAFVYIAAFGMFTEVAYTTDQQMKNTLGHMAYILEGAKSLSAVKPYHLAIVSDDGFVEGDFIYGMITNSVSVGGFKNLTGKDVKLDDGKFELTLVKLPKNIAELNSILSFFVTQKIDSENIVQLKTSFVKVKSEEEIRWTLDGEYGGSHKEVFIKNEQKAITVICNEK